MKTNNYNILANKTVANVLKASRETGSVNVESAIKYFKENKSDIAVFSESVEARASLNERIAKLTKNKAIQFNKNIGALFLFLKNNPNVNI